MLHYLSTDTKRSVKRSESPAPRSMTIPEVSQSPSPKPFKRRDFCFRRVIWIIEDRNRFGVFLAFHVTRRHPSQECETTGKEDATLWRLTSPDTAAILRGVGRSPGDCVALEADPRCLGGLGHGERLQTPPRCSWRCHEACTSYSYHGVVLGYRAAPSHGQSVM